MKMRATRSGIHLFDRRTGTNLLIDEVTPPSHLWALAPRHVSVALTNACDLSCSFCYAPKHHACLETSTVLRWAQELDALGCLGIGFGGGEPTLVQGFAELCVDIAASTDLAVQFTTHAHRLSSVICNRLAGHVSFVRISMDGVYDTYETLRYRSFKSLLEKFEMVRDMSPFGINCVVNADTIGELDDVIECAISNGAAELLLLPEIDPSGRHTIGPEIEASLAAWIVRNAGIIRIATSEAVALRGVSYALPFKSDSPLDSYAYIDASGFLRATSVDVEGIAIEDRSIEQALMKLREREGVT